MGRKAKRVLDIVIGLACLMSLSPLLMLIAIAVRWDSPGSTFYISDRAGRAGKSFRCVKFRTMRQGAHAQRSDLEHLNERNGVLFKIAKDPRITRIGAFLRKYSLDELPQLWNVLRGEMSLVGPRPPLHEEVSQYTPEQMERLDVEPGITGLWQVEARSDPSFDSYIRLDRTYIHTWSFWLDLKILARTVHVVMKGTGT
jgi:lipopolysaccharide/colanic/teichoic acid biosynthesis glycosyltransferase